MQYARSIKRHIVTIACYLICALSVHGGENASIGGCDSIRFTGRIMSLETGKPLSKSTLHEIGGAFEAIADEQGRFSIRICAGPYTLHISHLICEHIDIAIDLLRDTSITFHLPSVNRHLEPALVTDRRGTLSGDGLKIKREELRRLGSLSAGQAMEQLPGVRGLGTGSTISKPMVHGLYGYRTLIINQGVRQEGQNWGQEHAPEIDINHAKEVEIAQGPLAFLYGPEALGGVILVHPSSLFNNMPGVSGALDLTAGSNGRPWGIAGLAEGKIPFSIPVYWRLQGTAKQSGNVRAPGYYIDNTGYREQNWGWALGTHHKSITADLYYSKFYNPFGVYSGAHIGNLTDLNLAIQGISSPVDRGFSYTLNSPRQEAMHELFKARIFYKVSNHRYIKLLYARQFNRRKEFDLHGTFGSDPSFDYKLTTHTLDISYEFETAGIAQQVGANLMYQGNTFRGRFFIPNFEHYGAGGYYYAKKTADKWDFSGTIRADIRDLTAYYFITRDSLVEPHVQFGNVSGSIMGEYAYAEGRKWSFYASRNWRSPMPNELYSEGIHHGTASYEEGNAELGPELAHKIAFLWLLEEKRHRLTIGAHIQHVSDFINLIPASEPRQTIRGAFPYFYFDPTDALFRSVQYQYEFKINRQLSLVHHSDLLWAWDLTRSTYLAQMPPFLTGIELRYTGRVLEGSLKGETVFRQFRFDPNTDFAPPPPGYTLISAELHGKKEIGTHIFQYYVRGSNLGNTAYRDYLDRFRYFIDRPGIHIQVGISWDF